MLYLLDTNAISDMIREHPVLEARIAALRPADQIVTCTIVIGEVMFGIVRLPPGKRRDELMTRAKKVFARIASIGVDPEVADHYATIKHARDSQGLSIDDNDAWIAATARHVGATLVSRDSDIQNVPGLVVQDWTK